jgi:site-specific DNA recombinase
MKYAIYKRYSTDKQDSLTQDKEIADWLEYKKIQHSETSFFIDDAESGSTGNRADYRRLLIAVKNKEVGAVVAYKLDRLSRSNRDLQNLLYELKENDVKLILVSDNIDTSTTQGKMLFDLYAMFAEFERNTILERTRAGRRRAEQLGKRCHRPRINLNFLQIDKYRTSGLSFPAIASLLTGQETKVTSNTVRKRYYEWKELRGN